MEMTKVWKRWEMNWCDRNLTDLICFHGLHSVINSFKKHSALLCLSGMSWKHHCYIVALIPCYSSRPYRPRSVVHIFLAGVPFLIQKKNFLLLIFSRIWWNWWCTKNNKWGGWLLTLFPHRAVGQKRHGMETTFLCRECLYQELFEWYWGSSITHPS